MAAQVKQMLNSLSNAGGSHKDITGKYREILEKIFKFNDSSLTEGLKTFIEAGKCIFFLCKVSLPQFWSPLAFILNYPSRLCCEAAKPP